MSSVLKINRKNSNIYERRESEVRTYCRNFPVEFARAFNATLETTDGKQYIDFLSGCSTLNYGHNDPDLKAALIDYMISDGIAHGLDKHTQAKTAFLDCFETLILQPRNMTHRIMFTGPTGTNAIEASMKLARKITGRQTIACFSNGFHGMTMGALAATGNRSKRQGAGMILSGVQHLPYEGAFGPDVDTLELIRTMLTNPSSGYDVPAAFLMETVQGEGGLNTVSKEWVQGIDKLAKELGAILIIDDIQAGLGRAGGFFSFDNFGIMPGIIAMAKSLSGLGLPFSIVLIEDQLDIWKPGEHNGTFRGNNHAFVTAKTALEKFWSGSKFLSQVQVKADLVHKHLQNLASLQSDFRVKGKGMMQGLDVGCGLLSSRICRNCFDSGLIVETSGAHDEVIKILAPLTIATEHLVQGLEILKEAILEEIDSV